MKDAASQGPSAVSGAEIPAPGNVGAAPLASACCVFPGVLRCLWAHLARVVDGGDGGQVSIATDAPVTPHPDTSVDTSAQVVLRIQFPEL